jgi:PIN domain nuclease of toxin-antitoxin system
MDRHDVILLDTHAFVWALNDDARLGAKARGLIEATAREGRVLVSAITPWEIAMLAQKGRLSLGQDVGAWIDAALALPGIQLAPIEPAIAVGSARLPGTPPGDPADRIIIATARHAAAPLVTADREILGYAKAGHLIAVDAGK